MSFPNAEYPVLDGVAPSWADIVVKIAGAETPLIEMADIKSINTSCSIEVGEQRGASGGRVLKRTTGSSKHEASMVLYYSGFRKLLQNLKEAAPLRGNQRVVGLVHFGIQFQFQPPNDSAIYEVRIKGCRYLGRDLNPSEGTDAQTVDVKLNPLEVVDMIDGEEVVIL